MSIFQRGNWKDKGTVIPGKDLGLGRIEDVGKKLDILGRATTAGQAEKPLTGDKALDENQLMVLNQSKVFQDAVTRNAAIERDDHKRKIQERIPKLLDEMLGLLAGRQKIVEERDRRRGHLDKANKRRQRALSRLRAFEERNHLEPLSAHYKPDKAMFVGSLVALTIGESAFNAFTFEPLQDQGLLGGLVLATSVSVANVMMGLSTGWLGWRMMGHRRWSYKLLGTGVTALLMSAATALHLALGQLRETIQNDPKAIIDFLVILSPSKWLSFTSVAPFVVIAIGAGTFLISAFKGRGGNFGIVAPYWGHEILDREFREANRELEDAQENFINATMNAFDVERVALREQHKADIAKVEEIRTHLAEAETIERRLRDSIREEMERRRIWLTMYRERNCAVRNTPPPAYFDVYPAFEEQDEVRLDLSSVRELAAEAERILAENSASLARIESKMAQEQTAAINAMLSVESASEHRAAQQNEKDDNPDKPVKG